MEYERPNTLFFRFEDLRIYNKALDYVTWVYSCTQLFPDSEKQGITARFINASQAIAINIAEGSARNRPQFIYYLQLAKTAIRECIVLTTICKRLSFMTEATAEESRTILIELTRMSGAMITSLQNYDKQHEKSTEEIDMHLPNDSDF